MRKEISTNFIPLCLGVLIMSFIFFANLNLKDSAGRGGPDEKSAMLSIGHKEIKAYIADTPESQMLGLGGRKSISSSEAMLFVFNLPAIHGIWMKDMKFPIDILWLDGAGEVIFIKEDALPESYPEIFAPSSPDKYVLEAHAGFVRENNLKIGSKIFFSKL